MKKILTLLALLSFGIVSYAQMAVAQYTEYTINPIGIDVQSPRLAWQLVDSRQGAVQTAYRILVATDKDRLSKNEADAWDTGTVKSDAFRVEYAGENLKPCTRYYWKVICSDKDGKEVASDPAFFETGLMGMENWNGTWISDNNNKEYFPAPYFRKEFSTAKKVVSARAYVAVAGLYALYINGHREYIGSLTPEYTRFDRRILYDVYDVTDDINSGKSNAIGILLGNGWYNHQAKATWGFDQASWRNRPAFCLDLRIKYDDGTEEIITSDHTWKTTANGPLVYNNIYTGEHYDANLEMKGWAEAGFDDSEWKGITFRSCPAVIISSSASFNPIKEVYTETTPEVNKINDTLYVYDFKTNHAGNVELQVQGEKGTVVKMTYSERIHDDGTIDQSNIDVYYNGDKVKEPFQADIVTLSGGKDFFKPLFSYKGFRYVQVETSKPITLTQNNLKSTTLHSAGTQIGDVKASDDLITRLEMAARNSYASNFMGYPTDCPAREKNGWTGDAHIAAQTGLYNFTPFTIYEKWLQDHRDEQQPSGVLPDIIPTYGWGYTLVNGLDWTSTIILIPWDLYLMKGDKRPMEENYDNMKRYLNFAIRNSKGYLSDWGRGDWVPVKTNSNKELIMSTFMFRDADLLSRIANLLGKDSDSKYYADVAQKIRIAINDKYLNKETGVYADGSQTELSLPLMWGVPPEDMRAKVASALVENVKNHDYHIDAGVHGTKAVLNALSDNGYTDVAYKMATQKDYPSWGWWLVSGNDTFLENWDLNAWRDVSHNHIMFGDIGAWLYKGVGGIYPTEENPGFKHIILRPYLYSPLTSFEAYHNCPFGKIESKWEVKGRKVKYTAVIPANTTATLYLPENEEGIQLQAGTYEFTVKYPKNRK